MKTAADFLAFTDMSIQQVSSAVGIPDSNYFTKLFKHIYGVIPSEFRRAPMYAHTSNTKQALSADW